jgi:hypothetical protein
MGFAGFDWSGYTTKQTDGFSAAFHTGASIGTTCLPW